MVITLAEGLSCKSAFAFHGFLWSHCPVVRAAVRKHDGLGSILAVCKCFFSLLGYKAVVGKANNLLIPISLVRPQVDIKIKNYLSSQG